MVVYLDDDQVHVDWHTHDRLDRASLDMVGAERLQEDVVRRYETVREAMHTALCSVLNAFGYRTQEPAFGLGFVVTPEGTTT
ncbi:hypothetical protein OG453_44415 [Streptomyces sp. NBC_01381]|uniref:hypothetical protein n=1 Tax=Streptomyces sp. NBC_01381 TaxID=2903845 RepID=UPI002252EA65|nr:hypothetical protein [Streptomyces sp. NBC_01381]MCX4673603.1 hypothetical protein [Streptomyces sp. NBC_01381]